MADHIRESGMGPTRPHVGARSHEQTKKELKALKREFQALRKQTEDSKEPLLTTWRRRREPGDRWTLAAARAEEDAWRGATSTISRNQL